MDLTTGINLIASVVNVVDAVKELSPLYLRKKAEMEIYADAYKEQLKTSLNEIPEENRQIPKDSIIWPAFESSVFYLEEETYRNMFAKLVTSACDNRFSGRVHPFFIDAIKQMSPKDATLISSFKNDFEQPITNYRFVLKDGSGESDFQTYVFYQNDNGQCSPSENASAIINLERLGFVSIDFSRHFTNEEHYSKYQNDPFYCAMKHETVTTNQANPNWPYSDLIIQKGIVKVTPLGKDFISVCV